MLATMDKHPDKLGRAIILLPVLAVAIFAILPSLPGIEPIRFSIALLLIAGLLASGPLGVFATLRRLRRDSPRWWLPFVVGSFSFFSAAFTTLALIESKMAP